MYMYYIASGNSDDDYYLLIALITCTLLCYTGEGPTMVWSPDYIL